MCRRPFIEIKGIIQDTGLKEPLQTHLLCEQLIHVVLEEMGKDPGVLVLDNILDHKVNGSDLVVTESYVDGASTVLVLVEFIKLPVLDILGAFRLAGRTAVVLRLVKLPNVP